MIDLSDYAGQEVQLGFFFYSKAVSSSDVSAGWYIDDIEVQPQPLSEPIFAVFRPTSTSGTYIDGVELSWQDLYAADFDSTSYEIWRGTSYNRAEATLIVKDLSQATYFDTSTEVAVDYRYWIRAIRDGEETPFTIQASGYRGVAAPEDVKATQGDYKDQVRITWPRVSGVEKYSVYRHTSDAPASATPVASDLAATEYIDTTVDTGKNYYYWVTAQVLDKESVFSNKALGYAVGDALNTVRATDGLHSNKVTISWDAHEDADSYTLYRSLDQDALTAVAIASDITELSYDDTQAEKGTVYSYWVRVKQVDNLTGFSNRDSGHQPLSGDSAVVAWGNNEYGEANVPHEELTAATTSSDPDIALPFADTPPNILRVAGGVAHSLALRDDGKIVGWGRNDHGQLDAPDGLDAIDLAVGYDHSLALTSDGHVVGWGRNTFGKATPPANLPLVVDIAAGADHSLALLYDGTVIAWGGNDYGQTDVPEGLDQVVEISSGGYHSVARRADGSFVVWGDNVYGQLDVPERIQKVKQVSCGWNHTLVILADGSLDGWGDNQGGQLDIPSIPTNPQRRSPDIILPYSIKRPFAESVAVVDISGGLYHSLALTADGSLISWGEDRDSQSSTPDDLLEVSKIDAGDEHNVVVEGYTDPKIDNILPLSSRIELGEDLLLRARTSGAADTKYQWYQNGIAIEGATSETLLVPDIRARGKGEYSLTVTSKGKSAQSEPIPVVVTIGDKTAGFITGNTANAIRAKNGEWLSTGLQTDPADKDIRFKYEGSSVNGLPSGQYQISAYIDDNEYASEDHDGITLKLHNLDFGNELFEFQQTDGATHLSYLAVEGFSSQLLKSSDLKSWETIVTFPVGDGELKRYEFQTEPGQFYRVRYYLSN